MEITAFMSAPPKKPSPKKSRAIEAIINTDIAGCNVFEPLTGPVVGVERLIAGMNPSQSRFGTLLSLISIRDAMRSRVRTYGALQSRSLIALISFPPDICAADSREISESIGDMSSLISVVLMSCILFSLDACLGIIVSLCLTVKLISIIDYCLFA